MSMSSGTPSPVDTYSPINAASPIIAASPVSNQSSVSVVSPVKTASPISNVTCAITAATPVSNVLSQARIGSPKPRIRSPIQKLSTSPVNPVPPISLPKVESPESHSSTYSTVYSPNESGSSSNIDTDCCRNGIKVRRQRLRPWLINQINSGEIPGLVWLDKENMIFKIPWKHFGRPGVDMYLDALLFRRWALHTKKFEQGRPSDISTWKTRFRCALHKLPDIEELNDQNQTEGDEPYRVYKFRKIELETLPVGGIPVGDDEPESSIGSVGSPVSASFPVENTMLTSGVDTYRAPVTTVYSGVYPKQLKQEIVEKYVGSGYLSPNPRKRTSHKIGGMATTDIKKWQYYDQMRIRESYPEEKRSPDSSSLFQPRPVEKSHPGSDECTYDDEDDVRRKMSVGKPPNIKDDGRYHKEEQRYHKDEQRYQSMDYETDDDDNMSWNSRGCIQINQPIQSVPSIVPRYPLYYSESAAKQQQQQQREQRGFEPYERRYSTESTEVGVIKNVKSVQGNKHGGHSSPHPHDPNSNPSNKEYTYNEQDDNDLFFQSCAKRIKKLDTKSSGYLKLKILEHFYYVENFQHSQNGYYNQSYRGYPSDPPPLISSANVRTTEQVIDVDDSMTSV